MNSNLIYKQFIKLNNNNVFCKEFATEIPPIRFLILLFVIRAVSREMKNKAKQRYKKKTAAG